MSKVVDDIAVLLEHTTSLDQFVRLVPPHSAKELLGAVKKVAWDSVPMFMKAYALEGISQEPAFYQEVSSRSSSTPWFFTTQQQQNALLITIAQRLVEVCNAQRVNVVEGVLLELGEGSNPRHLPDDYVKVLDTFYEWCLKNNQSPFRDASTSFIKWWQKRSALDLKDIQVSIKEQHFFQGVLHYLQQKSENYATIMPLELKKADNYTPYVVQKLTHYLGSWRPPFFMQFHAMNDLPQSAVDQLEWKASALIENLNNAQHRPEALKFLKRLPTTVCQDMWTTVFFGNLFSIRGSVGSERLLQDVQEELISRNSAWSCVVKSLTLNEKMVLPTDARTLDDVLNAGLMFSQKNDLSQKLKTITSQKIPPNKLHPSVQGLLNMLCQTCDLPPPMSKGVPPRIKGQGQGGLGHAFVELSKAGNQKKAIKKAVAGKGLESASVPRKI